MDTDIGQQLIELEMQETRASLTEKLETLEQKVVGTVENATAVVTDTVDAIKETVQETVATVQDGVKDSVDSVKDFLDVPAQVQRRPWTMLGGSVAVGYCLGMLLTRNSSPATSSSRSWMPEMGNGAGPQLRTSALGPAVAPPAEPSIWDAELTKLKGLALGVLFGTARELLVASIPTHIGEQVKEVFDSVTKKVGGDPLPSSDWAKLCEEAPVPSASAPGMHQPTGSNLGNDHQSSRRW